MTEEVTARLENWRLDGFGFDIIWGEIYDDSKGRFPDGTTIHTSSIPGYKEKAKKFKKGDRVQTLNSVYLLGNKKRKSRKTSALRFRDALL